MADEDSCRRDHDPSIGIMSGLEELFQEIVSLIRKTPVTPDLRVSDTDKLRMYGLYKQATVGPPRSSGDDPNVPPSRFQLVARAKYQAWLDCRDMTTQQAMLAYVETTALQDHWLGKECAQKLREWQQSQRVVSSADDEAAGETDASREANEAVASAPPSTRDESRTQSASEDFTSTIASLNAGPTTKLYSWLERHLALRPLIPRGQLDISYGDLGFAAWQCLRSPSSMSRFCQLEQQVAQLWRPRIGNSASVISGLSVRSLLDLYLRVASFPASSEIIMTPPINIPGMMHVLRHHNINVVPVDIPQGTKGQTVVSVDVAAIKKAITQKTVAILTVHPFGMISTTSEDMNQLRAIADHYQLHLLEDCAECFTGIGPECYAGSIDADMTFFSFGTIKTATALGGGIAIVRNNLRDDAGSMNRIHRTLYKQQSATEYLWKVLCCMLVRFIADCPVLYRLIFALFSWIGLDFDAIVASSTRGFSPLKHVEWRGCNGTEDSECRSQYMRQFRKRPSTALLSLLVRRLEQSRTHVLSVKSRVEQCRCMKSLLEKLVPNVKVPLSVSEQANTCWLFPIQVNEPDLVTRRLRLLGIDAPRGLSQLELMSTHSSEQETCCRSEALMARILYLPVAMRHMSVVDIRQMTIALDTATRTWSTSVNDAESDCSCRLCRTKRPFRRPNAFVAFAVVCVGLDIFLFQCLPWSGFISCAVFWMLKLSVTVLSLAVITVVAFRCIMADFYLQSSEGFAKYNSMVFRKNSSSTPSSSVRDSNLKCKPIWNMEALKLPQSRDGVHDGVVLLTGATGLIGSLLLRDLLFHRNELSIQGGVVVLCRPKRAKSAQERISTLLEGPIFSFLSESEKRRLVRVVEGDVTQPCVGLSKQDREEICNSLNITHVIHCAASVSFVQTMKDAAISNITSSLNLQSLAGRMKRPSARYIHISTAFVHGEMTGTEDNPLTERLYSLGEHDATDLYRSMLGSEYYASVAMNELGFPNTYTFSKCVCEHLLWSATSVPTVVIRPSIVGPAVQRPYEGWAGSKPTTIVAAASLYMSYQWNLWCFGKHRVPYIPVDVVSRFVIVKAFAQEVSVRDIPNRECETPDASSSDDGFERVSQMSDSTRSDTGDAIVSKPLSSEGYYRGRFVIHNCAWDSESPDSAMFSWIDYAVAVTHLGAVLGYFSRLTAYVGLFFTVRLLPGMNVDEETFRNLHRGFVQRPIDKVVQLFPSLGCWPRPIEKLSKLSPFLELPLLFFPFMNNDFYFASDLVAPIGLDGEEYLFSCAVAAERFVRKMKGNHYKKMTTNNSSPYSSEAARPSVVTVGGAAHRPVNADSLWALAQPRGGFFVRLAGWMFRKVLRASALDVAVDVESFAHTALSRSSTTNGNSRPHLVLAPNHRSFFDFFLISYICFALPELHIPVPFIAAADDFERLPVLGWLAARANAFFIKRGRGKADPSLRVALEALKEECGDEGICVEVFVEGSRSRDRRYLRPKTGLIRCLAETGGDFLIVPISINYEEVPEQSSLSVELERGYRSDLNSRGFFVWLKKVFSGKVSIGRILVAAASPIAVNATKENDISAICTEIQHRQQDLVYISNYHIRATSEAFGLSRETTKLALTDIGCCLWPDSSDYEHCLPCGTVQDSNVMSQSEQWMVLLHCGHKFSPFFETSHPKWSKWLNATTQSGGVTLACEQSPPVQALLHALGKSFDEADCCVDRALRRLAEKGFEMPDGEHVFQSTMEEPVDCPTLLLRAAIFLKLEDNNLERVELLSCGSASVSVDAAVVDGSSNMDVEEESLGFWGFRDSGFVLKANRNGEKCVSMKGGRYGISGKPLTKLIPFIESETKTHIDPLEEALQEAPVLSHLPSDLCDDDIELLKSTMSDVSISAFDRIRHGTGHSQEDVYLIRSGSIEKFRMPDAVVFPSSEEEVEHLVSLAKDKNWCLIPFGGGTNVTHATRCPAKEAEPRPILSVDMKLMAHVLWVNEEDGLAHVQAGITGRALAEEMARRGYTIGHEPDSIEFSTLGGWISTKASGMKKNKYGNIEDIVKSVRVVGSNGVLWRGTQGGGNGTCGRESRGTDLLSVTLGSEGSFGIITSSVLRIWPLPECQEYESIVFPDFDHGLRFVRDAARLGPSLPSSVRLLDNEHFRLGQALQGDTTLLERALTYVWKAAHPIARLWSPDSVVCATILYEGAKEEVQSQRSAMQTLSSNHGGTSVGTKIGKSGYDLTFAIAYLRDFALTYNLLAESFETFAPWSKVDAIIKATRERIKKEHRLRCLPGDAFVGARVTQLYHEGACLYFYFCMSIRNVKNPSIVFSEIEHAAREAILEGGGSLSHHHGIGKVRSEFAKQMDSDAFRYYMSSLKKSVDPSNTFGARNGAL